MPINQLLNEMTYEELLGWFSYFESRPIGWRDDDRAAKLIQAQGVKEKPWKIFPSLDAIYNRKHVDGVDPAVSSLKGSVMFQKMMRAKGGDALDL